MRFRKELLPASPGLLRDREEFSRSLRAILDILRAAAEPSDTDRLDAINTTRNEIAHGRLPPALPISHNELSKLLSRLVDRQL
jgi:hypothetical protein